MNLSQHAILKVSLFFSVFRSINFPFSQIGVEVFSIAEKNQLTWVTFFLPIPLNSYHEHLKNKVSIFFFFPTEGMNLHFL